MLQGIKNDLMYLLNILESIEIISDEIHIGNFSMEEYTEASKSFYYRHIDFKNIL